MKNPKAILIAVGAMVLIFGGLLFVRGPKPSIGIKAEAIAKFGPEVSLGPIPILPFPLLNTYVTSVLVVIVLVFIAYFATRKLSLIPSGLQNVVEAVMEAMYNICVNTAGEKNGRRFFPVVMTIFTFIWIANWMALLPFFNAIGTVENMTAEEFHNQAVVTSSAASINFIVPNQNAIEFNPAEILNACAQFTSPPTQSLKQEYEDKYNSCILGTRGLLISQKLDKKEGTNSGVAACQGTAGDAEYDECTVAASNRAIAQLEDDGKKFGSLIPFFRSMNTDINSPLSLAIMAMIFIEFWGISALGLGKYLGKFFVNPFTNAMGFFVGLLEFVAELVRLISFSFRLFGNMLAGEILLLVMTFLVPFLVAIPFYGLETFVGIIQAFVFAMLTLVFGTLAVSSHDDHEDHGQDEPGPVHIDNIPSGVEAAH